MNYPAPGTSGNITPFPTVPTSPTVTPSPSPTPAPGSWTMVDEIDPSVSYSSGWAAETQAGAYMNTQKWTSNSGATASFNFTGSGVQIYSKYAPNHGSFDVSIDNIYQTTIDTYAVQAQWQVLVYETSNLSFGNHTLTITCKATANHPYIVADAFAYKTPASNSSDHDGDGDVDYRDLMMLLDNFKLEESIFTFNQLLKGFLKF